LDARRRSIWWQKIDGKSETGPEPRILTELYSTIKMQSAASFLNVLLCSAIVHMSVPLTENLLPPRCEICDIGTVRIGKLPPIGLRPLVYVYKCDACNQITSVEPGRQDDTSRRRVTTIRRPRR
jgi:hypothetical protein